MGVTIIFSDVLSIANWGEVEPHEGRSPSKTGVNTVRDLSLVIRCLFYE